MRIRGSAHHRKGSRRRYIWNGCTIFWTNGDKWHCLALCIADILALAALSGGVVPQDTVEGDRLTDTSDLHKYIGHRAIVSRGTQELCLCYTLTMFDLGGWSIATSFLCLPISRYCTTNPIYGLPYKNGAPGAVSPRTNLFYSWCSSDRDPVVAVPWPLGGV